MPEAPEKRRVQGMAALLCLLAALLAWPVYSGMAGLQNWEGAFHPAPGLWAALALLAAAACGMVAARRLGKPVLPGILRLAGIILLAVVYDCCCNQRAWMAPWQLHLPMFMAAALLCVLWALLRKWALVLWVPFMFLELLQLGCYVQYGSCLNSLVVAESLECSMEEALAYITPLNLCLLAAACALIYGLCRLQVWILRPCRRLALLNTGLLSGAFALGFAALVPPHHQSEIYYWPAAEYARLYTTFAEALGNNGVVIETAENLPSAADPAPRGSVLHGQEGVVLVLHVGESVRSDHMSLNGYGRDTTPWLRSLPGLVNYPDCISAACDTCRAEIAILTDARRDLVSGPPEHRPHVGSVLDILDAAGFGVYSFFGQRVAQQLKYDRVVRVLTRCSRERFNAPGMPWTSVPQMEGVLRQNPRQNMVFFINNEGSHTPFNNFDPAAAPFLPATSSFQAPSAQAEKVTNAYDNTIHYTDEYMRRVAALLQGRPFVYLYVSDHGEYLGDDGIWGRAAMGDNTARYHATQGCRVPLLVFCSPEFTALHPHFAQALDSLRAHSSMRVGHEHVFHTLLGLFGIRSPYYNPALDLTAPSAEPYSGPMPQDSAACP